MLHVLYKVSFILTFFSRDILPIYWATFLRKFVWGLLNRYFEENVLKMDVGGFDLRDWWGWIFFTYRFIFYQCRGLVFVLIFFFIESNNLSSLTVGSWGSVIIHWLYSLHCGECWGVCEGMVPPSRHRLSPLSQEIPPNTKPSTPHWGVRSKYIHDRIVRWLGGAVRSSLQISIKSGIMAKLL